MKLEEVPELSGWATLTDAARELGVTRQAVHKMVATDRIKTAHKIGPVPVYVMKQAELTKLLEEKAGRVRDKAERDLASSGAATE